MTPNGMVNSSQYIPLTGGYFSAKYMASCPIRPLDAVAKGLYLRLERPDV